MITNTGISKSALSPAIENLAYTKEETDDLLDTKADVTALSDGSVTKVGTSNVGTDTKPIKLVGGVPTAVTNDLVDTNTAQTINATKTFKCSANDNPLIIQSKRASSASGVMYDVIINTSDNQALGHIESYKGSTQTSNYISVTRGNTSCEIGAIVHDTQGAYGFGPTPGASAPSTALATVGYIDSYAPMLRTTGNQEKAGILTFLSRANNGIKDYATSSKSDEYVKRVVYQLTGVNLRMRFMVIDSRADAVAIATVTTGESTISVSYANLVSTMSNVWRLYTKDGNRYIGMEMPYHQGYTLLLLTSADLYGNNILYKPMMDDLSTDYTEVAHT